MMYRFSLNTDARVQVRVTSSPKSVDVMLMTGSELAKYQEVKGKLFGGKFTYRVPLSRQNTLDMDETEVLPADTWAIVVEVRQTSVIIMDTTAISIDVIAY